MDVCACLWRPDIKGQASVIEDVSLADEWFCLQAATAW